MFETSLPSSGGVHWGPVAVILLFLVLVIIALAVFLIYSAIYRHRVNRALRQETPVGPTPEPRNAGKFILIALVAACVLWFLIWTVNQQKHLAKLEEDISVQMSEISEQMSAFSDLLDQQAEALRQQNNPFSGIWVECTAIYPESLTMELTFTAATKTVTEDTFVRMMPSGGSTVLHSPSQSDFSRDDPLDMERLSEECFRAVVIFPLFNGTKDRSYTYGSENASMDFELNQNGVKQTVTFEYKNTIWQEKMPVVKYCTDAEHLADYGYYYDDEYYERIRNAELILLIEGPNSVSDISLCFSDGGQITASVDLSEYLVGADVACIPLSEEVFQLLGSIPPPRSRFCCNCLCYTDSYGFVHQRPVDNELLNREMIFDAAGNQLGFYLLNWAIDS